MLCNIKWEHKNVWSTEKDIERIIHCVFEGIMPAFAWRVWGKQWLFQTYYMAFKPRTKSWIHQIWSRGLATTLWCLVLFSQCNWHENSMHIMIKCFIIICNIFYPLLLKYSQELCLRTLQLNSLLYYTFIIKYTIEINFGPRKESLRTARTDEIISCYRHIPYLYMCHASQITEDNSIKTAQSVS
jgi:hypothetical protein